MVQYPEIQPQSTSNAKDLYVKSIIGTRSDTVFTFNQSGTVDRATPAGVNLVRAIIPADATILHVMGLNHEKLVFKHLGRRYRLTDVAGKVVQGILA